jgi:hypothetical protein
MESKHIETTMVVLELKLTEKERQWLHNVMQNPLHNQNPHEEDELDSKYRQMFFELTG